MKAWRVANRERYLRNQRRYRKRHPKRYKAYDRKRDLSVRRAQERQRIYGITPEQYEAIFDLQKRCCAICKVSCEVNNVWHVEHDHKTGRIRGITCSTCNLGLGAFKDSVENLQGAIDYLSQPPAYVLIAVATVKPRANRKGRIVS